MLDRVDERASGIGAQRLAHTAHERRGYAGAAARVNPMLRAPLRELPLQDGDERGAMFDPARVRGEAFVVRQLRMFDDGRAEQRVVPIGAASDDERPVAAVEELIRDDRRMRVAPAL